MKHFNGQSWLFDLCFSICYIIRKEHKEKDLSKKKRFYLGRKGFQHSEEKDLFNKKWDQKKRKEKDFDPPLFNQLRR